MPLSVVAKEPERVYLSPSMFSEVVRELMGLTRSKHSISVYINVIHKTKLESVQIVLSNLVRERFSRHYSLDWMIFIVRLKLL